ncbi:MAG: NAD-dependent epimerase/dehydratase family protein [Verrucomicrobiota bacterium]
MIPSIDRNAPVLVTGATGYVAGWLVKKLLDEGLTVHAAVRDPHNEAKLQHLNDLASNAPGTIAYFKADLLDHGSFAAAMQGCELVYHTASPFTSEVTDPQKELIDPAMLGTRNVLEEASRTPSVKRVVVTSSCAAMYGDNADLSTSANGVLTEEDWNTSSSLHHQAYSYSKTVAEQEAWKIAKEQDQWDLVTVNPSFVIGPGINPKGTSESFTLIKNFGNGTFKSGVANFGIGCVDVRDLAEAHFKAGFTPAASGRHIISGHNTDFLEMGLLLEEKFGDRFPIPKKSLPKPLLWLIGPSLNKMLTRKVVARNIDVPWKADNGKSIRELSMTYRPLRESMEDFFQQLVDSGQIQAS